LTRGLSSRRFSVFFFTFSGFMAVFCLDQINALRGLPLVLEAESAAFTTSHVVQVPDMGNMAVPAKHKVYPASVQEFKDISRIDKDGIFPSSKWNRDKVVVQGEYLEIFP
jgi:predicted cobalt transporter CbtA